MMREDSRLLVLEVRAAEQERTIEELSGQLETEGADTPSVITELSAESMKMGFLSQSSHTSISSVSEALSTMARKQ